MFEEEFLETEVAVLGSRGATRAVCGESATTDGQREAGREEPALLPSPLCLRLLLPPISWRCCCGGDLALVSEESFREGWGGSSGWGGAGGRTQSPRDASGAAGVRSYGQGRGDKGRIGMGGGACG